MKTVLLVSDFHPKLSEVLAQLLATTISYCFFYAEGVNHATQNHLPNAPWRDWANKNPALTLSCCRTGLLRRGLLQEQETLTAPWQLASLTEFYDALKNSDSLIHINAEKSVVLPLNLQKNTAGLLFQLNSQSKVMFPEEVLEFIIAGSLYFETHAYCSEHLPQGLTQKHLSALPLYEVQLHLQPPTQQFDLMLEL